MCGRYFFDADSEEIKQIIKKIEQKHIEVKTGEIFPSNNVAVITSDPSTDDADYVSMIWGFKGFKGSQLIINARAETVREKKMFAAAFKQNRCVFPATGFYEWDAAKRKILFQKPKDKLLYLAGFFKKYDDGNHSIILTATANASVKQVHDRMPVILEKNQIDNWLTNESFAEEYLKEQMPQLVSKSLD